MDISEARTVAFILEQADNGCPRCIEDLCKLANEKLPQYRWEFQSEDSAIIVHPKYTGGIVLRCGICKHVIAESAYYLQDNHGDYFHAECLK